MGRLLIVADKWLASGKTIGSQKAALMAPGKHAVSMGAEIEKTPGALMRENNCQGGN